MAPPKDPRAAAEAVGARRAAILMVSLDQESAARLMAQLDKPEQERIATEIVRLDAAPPDRAERVEKALQGRLAAFGASGVRETDGIAAAAKVLNHVSRATERAIMENLRIDEPDLVEKLRRQMFVFADLIRVNDRGVQNLLKT